MLETIIDIFGNFYDWLAALHPLLIYTTIFVIAFGENVLPPIPGDLVVVFGGYLAGQSILSFWPVLALSIIGGTLGFMVVFWMGRHMGGAFEDPDRFKWLPKRYMKKAGEWIASWGYLIIVANRFLSGTRSIISVSAGMSDMKYTPTFIASAISSVLWCGLLVYLGYKLGEEWELVGGYLKTYGQGVMWFTILVIGFYLFKWYFRTKGPDEEGALSP